MERYYSAFRADRLVMVRLGYHQTWVETMITTPLSWLDRYFWKILTWLTSPNTHPKSGYSIGSFYYGEKLPLLRIFALNFWLCVVTVGGPGSPTARATAHYWSPVRSRFARARFQIAGHEMCRKLLEGDSPFNQHRNTHVGEYFLAGLPKICTV